MTTTELRETIRSPMPAREETADSAPALEAAATATARPEGGTIEVRLADGAMLSYSGAPGLEKLRADIIEGRVGRSEPAREWAAGMEEPDWSTLDSIIPKHSEIDRLYHPVWHHTMKGMMVGGLVGIILKALDTTWLFFQIDERLGGIWLLVVGSLLVARWFPAAPIIVILASLRFGVRANLFVTALVVGMVGFIFGAPLGMAIGTLVGLARRESLPAAPGTEEGSKPVVWGLMVPAAIFASLLYAYLAWVNPMIFGYLSE